MNDFQAWCKDILPIVQAAADGEEVELLGDDGQWVSKKTESFHNGTKYRVKPRTILIGDYDVPEPMRVEPESGDTVFITLVGGNYGCIKTIWAGLHHSSLLSDGVVHKTREAAELHAEALISLTKLGE